MEPNRKKAKKAPARDFTTDSHESVAEQSQNVFTPSSQESRPSSAQTVASEGDMQFNVDGEVSRHSSATSTANSGELDRIVNEMIDMSEHMDKMAITPTEPASQSSGSIARNSPRVRGLTISSASSAAPSFIQTGEVNTSGGQNVRPFQVRVLFPNRDSPEQTTAAVNVNPAISSARGSLSTSVPQTKSSKSTTNRRSGRSRKQQNENEDAIAAASTPNSGHELYAGIFKGNVSQRDLVDKWIQDYRADRVGALLKLKNFLLLSSGCTVQITPEMNASMNNNQTVLKKVVDDLLIASEVTVIPYPMADDGQEWNKFRKNFCDFIVLLIRQCNNSIILDAYFTDVVFAFLKDLSQSKVRTLRHTATVAALKIMTAITEIALHVSMDLDTTKDQLESEKQKSNGISQHRVSTLEKRVTDLDAAASEHIALMTFLQKAVFSERCLDPVADIRSLCIVEFKEWVTTFPKHFVRLSFLKYIGWTLSDPYALIRVQCLEALLAIFMLNNIHDLADKLEQFTSKYKNDMVKLAVDEESEVAVAAIKLICVMQKLYMGTPVFTLTELRVDTLYMIVFHKQRSVALAAGEFLIQNAFMVDENESFEWASGKEASPYTSNIRTLVQFYIDCNLPNHHRHLVDSLIDLSPMLTDWAGMTDLLLEESRPEETNPSSLTRPQEESLCKLMVAAIHKAVTGETPEGRFFAKKAHKAIKEKKALAQAKRRMNDHFIPVLPLLLGKYANAPSIVSNLLTIPLYFDLTIYTSSRHKSSMKEMFKAISKIQDSTAHSGVLEAASKTIEFVCSDHHLKSAPMEVAQGKILDLIWGKTQSALEEAERASQDNNADDVDINESLIASLRRLATSSANHSFESYNIWDSVFRVIRKYCNATRTYPMEAVKYAITTCFYSLLWNLKSVEDKGKNEIEGTDEIPKLHRKLQDFMLAMSFLMSPQSRTKDFAEDAYKSTCDILAIFSFHLKEEKWTEILMYEADELLISSLHGFLVEYVFLEEADDDVVEDADEQTKLGKKRSLFALYAKLLVMDLIPMSAADVIIAFYAKLKQQFGDIMKATLLKVREFDPRNFPLTVIWSLQKLFSQLNNEIQDDELFDRSLHQMKDLAQMLTLIIYTTGSSNEDMTRLHLEGISFALTQTDEHGTTDAHTEGLPPNLQFLHLLIPFSAKLSRSTVTTVKQRLTECSTAFSANSVLESEGWLPFKAYQESLGVISAESEISTPFKNQNETPKNSKKRKEPSRNGKITRSRKRRAARTTTASSQ